MSLDKRMKATQPVASTSYLAPVRRSRKAETRRCPVCDEQIPVRLLAGHVSLELDRVVRQTSDFSYNPDLIPEEDGSPVRRRSANKARRSIASQSSNNLSLASSAKTIQLIQRRRRQRHADLRTITRDEDNALENLIGQQISCPVCLQIVLGDKELIEAHIESCLTHAMARQEAEDNMPLLVTEGAAIDSLGFHSRIDDGDDFGEVDIEGSDEGFFGEAQFTETDLLIGSESAHISITDDDDSGDKEPTESVKAGGLVSPVKDPSPGKDQDVIDKADALDNAVILAKRTGDSGLLLRALEAKIDHLENTPPPTCKICLSPYVEPTAATGCWHVSCRECWLRCLGSNKLCPVCKRITAATELRRIYI